MIPSLQIGDHILVNKLAYGLQIPQDCEFEAALLPVTCYSSSMLFEFEKPERGDIIVFRYPEDEHKDFIKRIVGLPGDTIRIQEKIVYINGERFQGHTIYPARGPRHDRWPDQSPGHVRRPVTVPPGLLFCHGRQPRPKLGQPFLGIRART